MTDQQNTDTLNTLLTMGEQIDNMRALVKATRDKLEHEDGFSPTAAESMALVMWRAMWGMSVK